MKLTTDESRAMAFIAAILFLSAGVRFAGVQDPVDIPGSAFDVTAHISAVEAAVADAERAAEPLGAGERLDPNGAPVTELMRLPGVGRALAERIVAEREANGAFRSAEDLTRVRGIGSAMVEKMRPHLEVSRGASMGRVRARSGRAGVRERPRGAARSGVPGGAEAAAGSTRAGGSAGAGEARPVDLNRADSAALLGVPGIGPVLAGRIVAYRDSAGPFRAVEDLLAVRGIGPASLERMRARVAVR